MHQLFNDFDARLLDKETRCERSEEFAGVPDGWQDKLFLNRTVHLLKLFQRMCLIELDHIVCDTTDDRQIGQGVQRSIVALSI